MLWLVIDKWKGNNNGGLRWKLIIDWPHQYFVKIL